jgi:cell division protein FtsX
VKRVVAVAIVVLTVGAAAGPALAGSRPVELSPDEMPAAGDSTVFVFLEVDATEAQISAVRAAVEQSTDIEQFAFTDKQAALSEFREIFGRDPDLIEVVTADALPVSFGLEIDRDANVKRVERRFDRLPGVEDAARRPRVSAEQVKRHFCRSYRAQEARDFTDLEVFLVTDASRAEIAGVRAAIEGSSSVERFVYFDKQDALAEFKRIFRDDPKLLKGITADALPVSFRVWVAFEGAEVPLHPELSALPGVEDVALSEVLPPGTAALCVGS